MALVAYEYSDNECSEDEEFTQPQTHHSTTSEITELQTAHKLGSDFTAKPSISDDEDENNSSMIEPNDIVEEEYKMRIPASAVQSSCNKEKSRRVKLPIKRKIERPMHLLSVPTVDQFDSSDDEENVTEAKKKAQSNVDKKSGNGLLTLLPQPKSFHTNVMSAKKPSLMVPLSVSRPTKKITQSVDKPKMDILPSFGNDSTDSEAIDQSERPQSFFSFYDPAEENRKISNAAPVTMLTEPVLGEQSTEGSLSPVVDHEVNSDSVYREFRETNDSGDTLLQKVLESDRSIRRLKGQSLPTEFVDVNQADLTAGAEIEVTKGLSEESGHKSQRSLKHAQPSNKMAGRKHQITWLAFKAKEREFELQNMWAENRMSKKQTQSKYGF